MPLPESPGRRELHLRRIEMRGYARDDGLYEIDGRVTDTKSDRVTLLSGGEVEAGDAIHDLWVRIVIDEDMVVHDIVAASDVTPYAECGGAVAAMRTMIGAQIRGGWSLLVKERLGGAKGCTHLMELLIPMATTAYQMLSTLALSRPEARDRRGVPVKIDSCYAYARQRDIVRRRWPEYYVAPAGDESPPPAPPSRALRRGNA